MASGNTVGVFLPHQNTPPTSGHATKELRGDNHMSLKFVDASTTTAVFPAFMPRHYSASPTGLTVTLVWSSPGGAQNVRWEVSFQKRASGADITNATYGTAKTVDAANGSASTANYATIAFAHGAETDSVAAAQMYRLKVSRLGAHANDTLGSDAYLLRVELRET